MGNRTFTELVQEAGYTQAQFDAYFGDRKIQIVDSTAKPTLRIIPESEGRDSLQTWGKVASSRSRRTSATC